MLLHESADGEERGHVLIIIGAGSLYGAAASWAA